MVMGTTPIATRTAGTRLSSCSTFHTSGESASISPPTARLARTVTVVMVRSMAATWSGAEATRRAAVACMPSCTTPSTSSSAIRLAMAPYCSGPNCRAAMIWKP